jgi:hypothetical protein
LEPSSEEEEDPGFEKNGRPLSVKQNLTDFKIQFFFYMDGLILICGLEGLESPLLIQVIVFYFCHF